ncbi:CotH kinase family protein [Candidatus Poriferisodalis sp.]|uniref:CotH kinase family protein n=1 Tax=Candidatus Poriferisodalis sp. TaxID=3101277 RepID=UPI003B027724
MPRRTAIAKGICAAGVALLLLVACQSDRTMSDAEDTTPTPTSAGAGPTTTTAVGDSRPPNSGQRAATTTAVAPAPTAAPFDASVVHDIQLSFDQADYDEMIESYSKTGDKEWIEATVTIDGITYERVGIRLKGNSSLFGLRDGELYMIYNDVGYDDASPDDKFVVHDPCTYELLKLESKMEYEMAKLESEIVPYNGRSEPAQEDDVGDASVAPGGFANSGLYFDDPTADEPEQLPWLIRLDRFVDDQNHSGYVDFVIRSNLMRTSLNEAVAQELLQRAGLAAQAAAHVRFTVNGTGPQLRLMVEHPSDDAWQERNFTAAGALYKAESGGDWSYRGRDADSYVGAFDQEGGKKVADLGPLMDFLKFLNEADDATFAAELPERLDIDAFVTYLAMMELIGNWDDIDGPGNNSYLWWDADAEQFTVVPWDMNLTFEGSTITDGVGFNDNYATDSDDYLWMYTPPGGVGYSFFAAPREGFDLPEECKRTYCPELSEDSDDDWCVMPIIGQPLTERFHANDTFDNRYKTKLAEMTEQFIDSKVVAEILAARVALLKEHATDMVDAEIIEQEAGSITAFTSSLG